MKRVAGGGVGEVEIKYTLFLNTRGKMSSNMDCQNVLLYTSPSSGSLSVVDIINRKTDSQLIIKRYSKLRRKP